MQGLEHLLVNRPSGDQMDVGAFVLLAFAFTGVMDASQLKGPVGSVVGCTIEEE